MRLAVRIPASKVPAHDKWIIANPQGGMLYRVKYDAQNFDMILDQLKSNKSTVDVRNRAMFIDDAFALAR